jgi:hypothetical protein
MKKHLSIVLFGIALISLSGCYTQVAVEENDDSYVYQEPVPVIIYYPVIEPVILPAPPHPPPTKPVEPPYKIRKPIKKRPHTGELRRPGKTRNPVTPPKRDDFRSPGKIRKPVTPPPNKDRITDDNRNRGGMNQDGRKSRR